MDIFGGYLGYRVVFVHPFDEALLLFETARYQEIGSSDRGLRRNLGYNHPNISNHYSLG